MTDCNQNIKHILECLNRNFQQYCDLLLPLRELNPSSQTDRFYSDLQQYLATLVAVENEILEFRLRKILEEEHPYLPEIKIERIVHINAIQMLDLPQLIDRFLLQRKQLNHLLLTVSDEEWNRTGLHAKEGHVSFREFVNRIIKKDQDILEELKQKLANQSSVTG